MTDAIPHAIVGSRRATALLSHWSRQDAAGFHAVVAELSTGRATVDLVMGLCTAAELLGERRGRGCRGSRASRRGRRTRSWRAGKPTCPHPRPSRPKNGEDE